MADLQTTLINALKQAEVTIQLDALNTFSPVITSIVAAVKANPALITDPVNFVLQGGVIEAEVLKSFPTFEQQVVTDLAGQMQTLLTTLAGLYMSVLTPPVAVPPATPPV